MEENSISIINRSGGQLTGEKAQSIPVKLKADFSSVKVFFIGFASAILLMIIVVTAIKQQVVVVEVAGKAQEYQEYTVN